MKYMDKKELILKEAEKLFAEKGYYGLGLSELLKRCGIPKGSFYYYFPDGKIQLIQEVLKSSYQKMKEHIARGFETEPSALASFEHMLDRRIRATAEGRQGVSLLMTMISIESVYLDQRVHETCRAIYQDWQQLYADHLLRHGFDEAESVVKAQAIFALVHGSQISAWIKQDTMDLQLAKKSLCDILADH